MKEEEGRCNATVKNKMAEVERDKKSAEAALDGAERQAEGQRVLLCNAKDQLAASKGQIIVLKKKLKEAEKAKEQAKKAKDQAKQ